MADPNAKLQITPKVIDLGDKVIQLTHVTSAGHGTTHPFRPAGVLLLLTAAGLVGFEAVTRGAAAFAVKSGGSLPLWLGFAAAGIGLFLSLFGRRLLVIRTVDGARTLLPASDDIASAAIVSRIRDAMEAAGAPAVIERARAQPLAIGAAAPDAAIAVRTGGERSLPASAPPAQIASQPAYAQPLGGARRQAEGHANGYGGNSGYSNGSGTNGSGEPAAGVAARRATTQPAATQRGPQELRGHQEIPAMQAGAALHQRSALPNTYVEPAAVPAAAPAPQRDDGSPELQSLMEHVRHADVQHKDALLDLLRVVDEHFRGRASREDAVAHWRSFADYVMQYLADVDGMMAHTERFGRHMLAR